MTFAETEKIELKQKLTDALPKEIVAFLNTDERYISVLMMEALSLA